MRELKGDVDLLGLDHLLQDLTVREAEGFLALERGREKQALHVAPTGIRLLASTLPRVRRIARIARLTLGGAKTPSAERLRAILKKEKLLGWSLGHLALSEAPITREAIEEALRGQIEEEVLDLFGWARARFAFKEGKLPAARAREPLGRLVLRANVTSLLLEAARREDEARSIRASIDERKPLRKVEREFHADALGEDVVRADAILPLINGRRSLRAILKASIYPNFSTLRAVHTLRAAGYVEIVGAELSLNAP